MPIVQHLAVLAWLSAGSVAAQASRPPSGDLNPDAPLNFYLMRELRTHSVGIVRRGRTVGITLEAWRVTDLNTESLEPIARRALLALIARDTTAANADSLFVRFSDYEPHVTTLAWTREAFPARPPSRTDYPDRPTRHARLCLVPGTPGTPDIVIPGSPGTPAVGDQPPGPATPPVLIPGVPATPDIVIHCR